MILKYIWFSLESLIIGICFIIKDIYRASVFRKWQLGWHNSNVAFSKTVIFEWNQTDLLLFLLTWAYTAIKQIKWAKLLIKLKVYIKKSWKTKETMRKYNKFEFKVW